MKSHYETLGVSPTATVDEIKKAYRKLCMETHPDVSSDNRTTRLFQQISEAHRVLVNPEERRLYDLERINHPFSSSLHRQSRQPHGFAGGRSPRSGTLDPHSVFVEGFFRPRNVMIGIALGFCTVTAFQSLFPQQEPKKQQQHLVEAWKNPQTGQWEQPAPWDATYRRLKPKLHMVPREEVRPRQFK